MTDDSLIEAMADAISEQIPDIDMTWADILNATKAALSIARPVIERETRERCARIADPKPQTAYTVDAYDERVSIAAAIREQTDD